MVTTIEVIAKKYQMDTIMIQGSNVFGSEQISGGPSEHPSAVFGSELGSNYLGTVCVLCVYCVLCTV